MFICICNGHRHSDISAAASRGHRSVREVYAALGGEPQCGQCLDMAEAVIANAAGEAAVLPADDGHGE